MAERKRAAPRKKKGDEPILVKDIKAKKVKWFWQERIPVGQIVIVAGKPDMGKGIFVSHVAADVSRRGGKVLWSAAEDSPEQVIRPRLEASGADLSNIRLWTFFLPGQFEEMAAYVGQYDVCMVVIDPISAHLNQGVTKTTDSIRKVTNPMQKLADRTGCAFVLIDHVVKKVSPNAHPLMAIGGASSGLPSAARMAYVFGKDPGDSDRMILCPVKHNLRSKPKALEYEQDVTEVPLAGTTPYLLPRGECDFDPMKLLVRDRQGKGRGRPAQKRAGAQEWLVGHLLIYGPVKRKTVLEDAKHKGGMSEATIRRAAEDIDVVTGGPGGAGGVTWDLPEEFRDHLEKQAKRKEAKDGE
jgi:hypothetical protein